MPERYDYFIVDGASREVLDRCNDHASAKDARAILQASRGGPLRIQKVALPDPRVRDVEVSHADAKSPVVVSRTDAIKSHKLMLSNRSKLDLGRERVSRLVRDLGLDSRVAEIAVSRLEERLRVGPWNREAYRKVRRRYRARPSDDGSAPTLVCEPVEIAVIRIVAQTYPYNQFAVTPSGDVFVGYQMGYHREGARLYVTTLSPILDEVADLLLARSLGAGGRFYVHRNVIERAAGGSLLAKIKLEV